MVEKIKETKDQVLRRMEQAINERGVDRMDVTEVGKLADIVKDLAQAEKECWEAEYYMSVSDAMEKSGYMPEGMGYDGMGYDGTDGRSSSRGGNRRSGYNQNRDSMGRYTSRRGYSYGYDHDPLQAVREAMSTASTEDRERMTRELRQMLSM